MRTSLTRKLLTALLVAFGFLTASALPAAASTPWAPEDGDIVIDLEAPEPDIEIDLETVEDNDCVANPPESDFDFSASSGSLTITDLAVRTPFENPGQAGDWYMAEIGLFPPNGGGTPHGSYSGNSSSSSVSGSVRLLVSLYSMVDYPDDCDIDSLECTASAWIDITNGVYTGDIENPGTGDTFEFDAASDATEGHITVHGCSITYLDGVLGGRPITGTDLLFEYT